jgi:hypothetical protein
VLQCCEPGHDRVSASQQERAEEASGGTYDVASCTPRTALAGLSAVGCTGEGRAALRVGGCGCGGGAGGRGGGAHS